MKDSFVLMLEHDDDDQFITTEYFKEAGVEIRLVNTSDELFQILGEGVKNNSPLPSLVVLSYNSGPLNAVAILDILKRNSAFSHIPVIVLSEVSDDKLIRDCYRHGASSFIRKPSSIEDTAGKISAFLSYWFHTVELA